MASSRKLEWLEAMRGLAALWVLIHHAGNSVDYFVGSTGARPWIDRGFLGVDFFFVLSGFIIAFASDRLFQRGGGIGEYLVARVIRIYVPYLPIGVGMLALYWLLPGVSEGDREVSLLTSFTLLPANRPPALAVAWTLVHEMIFYAVYATWFVNRTLFRTLLAIWVSAILVVAFTHMELSRAVDYLLSPLNLCFVAGVGVFHLSIRWPANTATAVGSIAVGVALLVLQVNAATPSRVATGAAFAFLVFAAASPFATRRQVWRPLVLLGAASYALYLAHGPVLAASVRLTNTIAPGIGVWPAFFTIATIAGVAGLFYWWAYERLALRWVRARVMPPRPAQAVQA